MTFISRTKSLALTATLLVSLGAATAPAAAATFDVALKNETNRTITRMAVLVGDGEIVGFETIPAGEIGYFQVKLADGECRATLRGRIGTRYGDLNNHNFCSGQNGFTFK